MGCEDTSAHDCCLGVRRVSIDWTVTMVFAAASIPLSSLGARTALRMNPAHLERLYGAGLLILGATLLLY